MNTSHHPPTHIGALISRGLVDTGKSLRVLAQLCGCDPAYLVRLRQGKVRHPREELLVRLAQILSQDVEDYHIALLADHGELPSWSKVLGTELGVRLNTEDRQAITRFVETMIRYRRGS